MKTENITLDFSKNCNLILSIEALSAIDLGFKKLVETRRYNLDISKLSTPFGLCVLLGDTSSGDISILTITSSVHDSIDLSYYELDQNNTDYVKLKKSADYVSPENFLEQLHILITCENTIVS